MTNREKLNQLSDAEWVWTNVPVICPPKWDGSEKESRCENGRYERENGCCHTCWIDWIGEEIEEVGNEENR